MMYLTRLGCIPTLSHDDSQRIVLTNQVSLFFIVPAFPYLAALLISRAYLLAAILPPVVVIYSGTPLLLNARRYYAAAKYALLTLPALAVLGYGLALGKQSCVYFLYFGLAALALVLFPATARLKLRIGFCIPSISLVLFLYAGRWIKPMYALSPNVNYLYFVISIGVSFSVIFFCIWFYIHLINHPKPDIPVLPKSAAVDLPNLLKNNHAYLMSKKITPRELDIISLVMQGHSNAKIAQLLFISESTTKRHVYNIFKKLQITNRFELLQYLTQNPNLHCGNQ